MEKHWTDRLSEYLDGHLDSAERREVERHLETCGECRGVLDDLKTVVLSAQGLQDREPAQDLWPVVAAGLVERGRSGGDVIQIDEHRRAKEPKLPSYVQLTMPQLAAAGLVLMMASGAGAWILQPALDDIPQGTLTGLTVQMASQVDGPVSPYAEEVAFLEHTLSQLGDVLAPSTLRIIQKNLIIIDQAIEESTKALENDPNDDFLRDYLDRVFLKKVEYLRETATIVGAEI